MEGSFSNCVGEMGIIMIIIIIIIICSSLGDPGSS